MRDMPVPDQNDTQNLPETGTIPEHSDYQPDLDEDYAEPEGDESYEDTDPDENDEEGFDA